MFLFCESLLNLIFTDNKEIENDNSGKINNFNI